MTSEAAREQASSSPAPGGASAGPWPVLDVPERRILGVLVEKAKTTPDAYPLSINALVTGSNQKSNRDPLLELSDLDVEDALVRCQKRGLVMKITGGRVERWRHLLYEAWQVNKVELAVLTELLLRGPQTEGELRGRASRMEPIDDLDALRAVLRPLVDRRLVIYLTAGERRGAMLTHGFHDPAELELLRSQQRLTPPPVVRPAGPSTPSSPASQASPPSEDRVPALEQRLNAAHEEIASLKTQVSQLQGALQDLEEQVRQIRQGLGL